VSYTSVYRTLESHAADHNVRPVGTEGYIEGEYTRYVGPDQTLRLAVLPLTARQILSLPAGEYTAQDVNAYEIGDTATLTRGAEIDHKYQAFVVQDILDRRTEGGYVRYLCKRIQTTEPAQ